MDPTEFVFAADDLPGLGPIHRSFLDQVTQAIRRARPPDLDLDSIQLWSEKGQLGILLPHRRDDGSVVIATVSEKEASVGYGCEHEHFWPDDPGSGRTWPIDAPDWLGAASRFVEQLLLGRIELEVRKGFLFQRTRSYWINDEGERELFLQGGTVLPGIRRRTELLRFDFGVHPLP